MKTADYALEPGGPQRVRVEMDRGLHGVRIAVDGTVILAATSRKDIAKGLSATLPDGSSLQVRIANGLGIVGLSLAISRDGEPLPGSAGDPVRLHKSACDTINAIAILTGIAATLSLFFPLMRQLGFSAWLFLPAGFFALLGYLARRGSLLALIVAIVVYAGEAIVSLALAPAVNGGIVVKLIFLWLMIRGIGPIRVLRHRSEQQRVAAAADISGTSAAPAAGAPAPVLGAFHMRCPKCGHGQTGTQQCGACGLQFETFYRANQKVRELNARLGRPVPPALAMKCPKCRHEQLETSCCSQCGLFFEKFFLAQAAAAAPARPPPPPAAVRRPAATAASFPLEPIDARVMRMWREIPLRTRIVLMGLLAATVLAALLTARIDARGAAVGGQIALSGLLLAGIACAVAALWRRNRSAPRLAAICGWAVGIALPLNLLGATLLSPVAGGVSGVVEATTFIVVRNHDMEYTGTGFLVRRDGANGVIATNAHVVEPERRRPEEIVVVFDSGKASPVRVPATILGVDHATDLALLSVPLTGVSAKPVRVSRAMSIEPTQEALVVGFPLGGALATAQDTPAATVSKGIISSVREDLNEVPGIVQVDADINPGNSGGPVIDSRGLLIGIARAKVQETQIGFAIPAFALGTLMEGQITNLQLRGGSKVITLVGQGIDPAHSIRGARLLLGPLGKVRLYHDDSSGWGRISAVEKDLEFTRDGADVDRYRIELPGASEFVQEDYVAQIALDTGTLGNRYQAPFRIRFVRSTDEAIAAGPGVLTDEAPTEVADRGNENSREKPARPKAPSRAPTRMPPPPVKDIDQLLAEADAEVFRAGMPFDDVVIGGAGNYIIATSAQSQLSVFDVPVADWRRVSVPATELMVAANRDCLFILLPVQKKVIRMGLSMLDTQMTVDLPSLDAVRGFVVGSDSVGAPLLIVGERRLQLLDPVSLTLRDMPPPKDLELPHVYSHVFPKGIRLRAAARANVYTWWGGDGSLEGRHTLRLVNEQFQFEYDVRAGGFQVPAPDGSLVYSNLTGRYSAGFTPRDTEHSARHLIPDADGALYLEVLHGERSEKDGVHIRGYSVATDAVAGAPVHAFEMTPSDTHPYGFHRMALAEDKRYLLVPRLRLLVTIPYSNDRVVLRTFVAE